MANKERIEKAIDNLIKFKKHSQYFPTNCFIGIVLRKQLKLSKQVVWELSNEERIRKVVKYLGVHIDSVEDVYYKTFATKEEILEEVKIWLD